MSTPARKVLAPEDAEKLMLTPRQLEVLNLMAEGLSDKNIARRLEIAPSTVKSHVSVVLQTFGVSTRTQVARKAILYAHDRALHYSRGRAGSGAVAMLATLLPD